MAGDPGSSLENRAGRPVPGDHSASGLRTTLLLAAVCGAVYLLLAGPLRGDFRQTAYVHHVYLAEALLHGQLHVTENGLQLMRRRAAEHADQAIERHRREKGIGGPPSPGLREQIINTWWNEDGLRDWTLHDSRLYGYWAPLLPVATIPFVMLGGLEISDRLISAILGTLNVGLFQLLLWRLDRLRLLPTTPACRISLTLLLAFGTVHFWMACVGQVWFTAQLVTLTALLGAGVAVVAPANRWQDMLAAGVLFGAAILGRNIAAATGLFFVLLIWARADGVGTRRLRLALQRLAIFAIPCLAAVRLQLAYNQARFGDILETGQAQLIRETGDPRFVADFNTYGQFHPHFLPRNAWHYLLNWHLPTGHDGRWLYDPDGNSVFLISPPLVYALFAWRRRSWLVLAAAAGVLPFFTALLFFRATGWAQFGNRYLLEVLPLLLILSAAGMGGRLTNPSYALIAAAMAVNAWGTSLVLGESLGLSEYRLQWLVFPAGLILAILVRALWRASQRRRGAATGNAGSIVPGLPPGRAGREA